MRKNFSDIIKKFNVIYFYCIFGGIYRMVNDNDKIRNMMYREIIGREFFIL